MKAVLFHKEVEDFRVAVQEGEMEFSFPQRNNISPIDVMAMLNSSPLAQGKSNVIVNFVRNADVAAIRIPDAKGSTSYTTEVMIPTKKLANGMVHSKSPYFSKAEISLCVDLYKLYNETGKKSSPQLGGGKAPKAAANGKTDGKDGKGDDKKIDTKDMSMDELRDGLTDLGVEVFMPPFRCPAIDPENGHIDEEHAAKMWSKIAGYNNPKACCKQSITLPLLRPDLFSRMAALARGKEEQSKVKRMTGVLMTGPPGVGKTSMAKVAGHAAGVPLVYVPVESVMSKWYGEAEQRLRSVFDLTRGFPRAVLFLDELDAFAGSRDGNMHEATRRILSVLLRQLDGLENEGDDEEEVSKDQQRFLVMVGATNRPDHLDAALLSRFDQAIEFPLPSEDERASIFGVYAGVLTPEERQELGAAAKGYAGRDIVEVCNQAQRMHLYSLLQSFEGDVIDMSVDDLSPPPVKVYLEAIAQRNAGNKFDAPGKH
eukprot:TRINITY_DN49224_c0_g1_i1.p1 TRINITY_DN49224_c0_g1~~TRINITY_DN49224_c0_g1_i1.p1  ORF type:complete len:568 (-),score=99.69 TRINITY_DN49224_c0_g1_i1:321-1772(-)